MASIQDGSISNDGALSITGGSREFNGMGSVVELYGWEGISRIMARVQIRDINPHNDGKVKPECWSIQGRVFEFWFAWFMEDSDPYPGEIAWTPQTRQYMGGDYPDTAPAWIASGDLVILEHL